MTVDIKVGDKVQVDMDTPGSSFHGVEGIVEEITPGKNHGYVRITKSNITVNRHTPVDKLTYLYNLTKVEESVTFKDFPVGTKVKITHPSYVGETGKVDSHTSRYIRVTLDGTTHGNRLFTPGELEIIEEKETKVVTLKTGDRIEFVDDHDGKAEVGDFATVTQDEGPLGGWDQSMSAVHYKLDKNGQEGECFVRRVKLAPEFTLKDVEVGDTIRRTLTLSDGSTVTKEGVVVRLDGGYASGNRITLALPSDTNNERVKLELINRPEKPKHWAHTKPVGALAVLRPTDRVLAATLTKTGKDEWVHNYVSNNNSRKYTNEQLAKTIYGTSEDLNWLN